MKLRSRISKKWKLYYSAHIKKKNSNQWKQSSSSSSPTPIIIENDDDDDCCRPPPPSSDATTTATKSFPNDDKQSHLSANPTIRILAPPSSSDATEFFNDDRRLSLLSSSPTTPPPYSISSSSSSSSSLPPLPPPYCPTYRNDDNDDEDCCYWYQYWDTYYNDYYYYNDVTKQSQWQKPDNNAPFHPFVPTGDDTTTAATANATTDIVNPISNDVASVTNTNVMKHFVIAADGYSCERREAAVEEQAGFGRHLSKRTTKQMMETTTKVLTTSHDGKEKEGFEV